jgi:aryl-alcohol dehydrogenase-like predicted oxidoreductase
METRQLGAAGPKVSELGLGCLGMSDNYGPADEAESVATIHAALDAGVTLLDTGDVYGMGHNELLIYEALRTRNRDDVSISVKTGGLRKPDGHWSGFDCRPEALWNFLSYTLKRLRTDHVDVYRPARIDPNVPIEETVGAIAEMVQAGYVRAIGLSEVGVETIRRAHAVHPIADVQLEYSLMSRGIEDAILPTCRELGVSVTAYGVLSRGLLSGHWTAERKTTERDFRTRAPRFQAENVERNLELVERLRRLAGERDATVAQLAIAWVSAQGQDIVPVVGARRRDQLAESLGAADLKLGDDDIAAIESAMPRGSAAGTRYAEWQMAYLYEGGPVAQRRRRTAFLSEQDRQSRMPAANAQTATMPTTMPVKVSRTLPASLRHERMGSSTRRFDRYANTSEIARMASRSGTVSVPATTAPGNANIARTINGQCHRYNE